MQRQGGSYGTSSLRGNALHPLQIGTATPGCLKSYRGAAPRPLPMSNGMTAETNIGCARAVYSWQSVAWMALQTLLAYLGFRVSRQISVREVARCGFCPPTSHKPRRAASATVFKAASDFHRLNEEATAGDVSAAEATFRSLDASWQQMPRSRQRVCVNTVIKACANAGDYARAEIWYEELGLRRLEPNRKSFGKLIESCAKAGKVEFAETWLHASETAGFCSNGVHYSAVIDACAKAGDTDGAKRWLDTVAARRVDIGETFLGSVITAFSQKGDAQGAERVLNQALEHPTLPVRVECFNGVMTAWGRQRKFEDAERVYQRMTALNLQPTRISYTALIDACSRCGQTQRADFWFEQLNQASLQPDLIMIRSLLSTHARASNFARTTEIFHDILNRRLDPGLIGYTAVATAHIQVRNMRQVENLIRVMAGRRITPDNVLCETLISGFGRVGDLEACEHWLEQAPSKDVLLYTRMLSAVCDAGLSKAHAADKAVALFQKMIHQRVQPNSLVLARFKEIVGWKRVCAEAERLGVEISLPRDWHADADMARDRRTVFRSQHKHTEKALNLAETREARGTVFYKPTSKR